MAKDAKKQGQAAEDLIPELIIPDDLPEANEDAPKALVQSTLPAAKNGGRVVHFERVELSLLSKVATVLDNPFPRFECKFAGKIVTVTARTELFPVTADMRLFRFSFHAEQDMKYGGFYKVHPPVTRENRPLTERVLFFILSREMGCADDVAKTRAREIHEELRTAYGSAMYAKGDEERKPYDFREMNADRVLSHPSMIPLAMSSVYFNVCDGSFRLMCKTLGGQMNMLYKPSELAAAHAMFRDADSAYRLFFNHSKVTEVPRLDDAKLFTEYTGIHFSSDQRANILAYDNILKHMARTGSTAILEGMALTLSNGRAADLVAQGALTVVNSFAAGGVHSGTYYMDTMQHLYMKTFCTTVERLSVRSDQTSAQTNTRCLARFIYTRGRETAGVPPYLHQWLVNAIGTPEDGLDDNQVMAVVRAVLGDFSLIYGKPGCGKSRTVCVVAYVLKWCLARVVQIVMFQANARDALLRKMVQFQKDNPLTPEMREALGNKLSTNPPPTLPDNTKGASSEMPPAAVELSENTKALLSVKTSVSKVHSAPPPSSSSKVVESESDDEFDDPTLTAALNAAMDQAEPRAEPSTLPVLTNEARDALQQVHVYNQIRLIQARSAPELHEAPEWNWFRGARSEQDDKLLPVFAKQREKLVKLGKNVIKMGDDVDVDVTVNEGGAVLQSHCDIPVTTIHRVLHDSRMQSPEVRGNDAGLLSSSSYGLVDTLIVEEAGTGWDELIGRLLQTMAHITKLVMLGDPNQARPIHEGCPFEDVLEMLKSNGVAGARNMFRYVTRLTTNHRSAGAPGEMLEYFDHVLGQNGQRELYKRMPTVTSVEEIDRYEHQDGTRAWYHVDAQTYEDMADKIFELYKRDQCMFASHRRDTVTWINRVVYSRLVPDLDFSVLSPSQMKQQKGFTDTFVPLTRGAKVRTTTKIVARKPVDDGVRIIENHTRLVIADIYIAEEFDAQGVTVLKLQPTDQVTKKRWDDTVLFFTNGWVLWLSGTSGPRVLALDYADTGNGMQGDEAPVMACVFPITKREIAFYTWRIVYTIVSRAQLRCYMVGPWNVAQACIAQREDANRITLLRSMVEFFDRNHRHRLNLDSMTFKEFSGDKYVAPFDPLPETPAGPPLTPKTVKRARPPTPPAPQKTKRQKMQVDVLTEKEGYLNFQAVMDAAGLSLNDLIRALWKNQTFAVYVRARGTEGDYSMPSDDTISEKMDENFIDYLEGKCMKLRFNDPLHVKTKSYDEFSQRPAAEVLQELCTP